MKNSSLFSLIKQISLSMRPSYLASNENGRYLDKNTASSAIQFLNRYFQLLPEKAHISSTNSGDLVVEFKRITCIISTKSIYIFTTFRNNPIFKEFDTEDIKGVQNYLRKMYEN